MKSDINIKYHGKIIESYRVIQNWCFKKKQII
jgi:hypothetical protein